MTPDWAFWGLVFLLAALVIWWLDTKEGGD